MSSSGSSTFWKAVSTGSRLKDWKTKPTFRERHSASCAGVIALTSAPPTRMLPLVGLSSPAMRLSSVDLPEPEGPMSAVKVPCSMSIDSPVNTSIRSASRRKVLWTFRISTSAMLPTPLYGDPACVLSVFYFTLIPSSGFSTPPVTIRSPPESPRVTSRKLPLTGPAATSRIWSRPSRTSQRTVFPPASCTAAAGIRNRDAVVADGVAVVPESLARKSTAGRGPLCSP